ncbi:phospholipase D family protein [Mangrovitalea sediminis]|uniref:phospholipase D family protein n=1 Tax=Mangrovitalea sediminis TaxID=1982043 RepID=UPI000BE5C5CE|nr:phospholipase D family protein [Mangrovitalea sediminis]
MANFDFLIQSIHDIYHEDVINDLLKAKNNERTIISVAFASDSGARAIAKYIKGDSNTYIFVGIRNGITSLQAINTLFLATENLYIVDTGSQQKIYHPKIYYKRTPGRAVAIIGSANLTTGGLQRNIEASAIIQLDLSVHEDAKNSKQLEDTFQNFAKEHPEHVIRINNKDQIKSLSEQGLLADENLKIANQGSNEKPESKKKIIDTYSKKQESKIRHSKNLPLTEEMQNIRTQNMVLVWKSKRLTRRDLSIPTAGNTHPTGSMGLKKGLMTGIDHRHYFRDEVFNELEWHTHSKKSYIEQAHANFRIIIAGINMGTYELLISHKTDTQSESYRQKNFMTQIHWGTAISIIADDSLLKRSLFLYKAEHPTISYEIEID